jgi:hypothetical protein
MVCGGPCRGDSLREGWKVLTFGYKENAQSPLGVQHGAQGFIGSTSPNYLTLSLSAFKSSERLAKRGEAAIAIPALF